MILPDWLIVQARARPLHPAVITADATVSFRALEERVDVLARRLRALGVGPGRRVATVLHNSLALVELVHAVPRAGAAVVLLDPRLPPPEAARQAAHARVALVVGEEATALSTRAAAEAAGVDHALVGGEVPTLASVVPVPVAPPPALELDAPHTVVFTSGTAGRARAVVLTAGNHLWSAIGSAARLGQHRDDRSLACLPLTHVGGLAILLRCVIAGTTVVLHRRFEAEAVARALRAGAVTLVSLVPTALVRLLDVLDGPPPPALRCVLVGGAAAPPALLAAARERGLPVAPTYGLTEAASQVATAAPDDPPDEAGAVGTPLLPTEVRVRAAPWKAGELAAPWTAGEVATPWKAGDLAAPGKACELAAGGEEGERGASGEGPVLAQPGEEGEILVRGPSVSPGYLAADGWITPVTVGGWLATGDLGHLRADGVLVVSGRCDDLIITGGENVAPAEVEAALLRHPAVAEAAVAGVPDAEWGQAVVAWVVPRPGTRPTLEELRAACRVALAPHKLPRRLVLVGALPRTAAGKVRRAVLRAPGESVSRVR